MRISVRWFIIMAGALVALLGLAEWEQLPAIATAAAPPQLVKAKLGGKPVSVLYVTRSEDTVLVRCYPGQTPTLAVRAMGGQATVKEGVLTCQ